MNDKIITLRVPDQHQKMLEELLERQQKALYPYVVTQSDVIRIAIFEKWEREIGQKS